jgi:ATP-binding cassette, subfamily C, bacterial CydC
MTHSHSHTTALGAPVPVGVSRPLLGLMPYLLAERLPFAIVIVSGIVYWLLAIATAAFAAWLVGSALSGSTATDILSMSTELAALVVATAVAQWWQSDVAHDWAFRLLRDLRLGVFDGLARATPGRILDQRTGDLTATAIGDVNTTEQFIAHTAGDYIGTALVSVLALVVIARIDPLTGFSTLLLMLLVAVLPYLLARQADREGARLRAELATLNAEVVDGVQGLRELVIFKQTTAYLGRLLDRTRRFEAHQLRYARRAGLEQSISDLLLAMAALVTPLVASRALSAGHLEVRWLPVLVVLAMASLGPIATVSATARTLGNVRAAASRLLTILRYPAHVVDAQSDVGPTTVEPRVTFDNVHFGYSAERGEVLRGIDLSIAPGETVALVGASGAGKTTCASLLLRFWDPTHGHVLLGGRDLRRLPLAALRRYIAVVPQDVYLFHGSVADNIRLGRPDATDVDVQAAAELAHAHDFIMALPDGYATSVGERGAQLSGGQRQRVAIARALLVDAPVLVMDEAVSNLDSESEQAVQSAIAAATRGRTTLIIAHRVSTIRSSDRVLLLDDGRVVASGSHAELLRNVPMYSTLLAAGAADEAAAH